MTSDNRFAHIDGLLNNQKDNVHIEKPSIQQTLSAKAVSSSTLNTLPYVIRAKLRSGAWSLIPNRQSDVFRYQRNAMFWVLRKNDWHQVSYTLYSSHSNSQERYAFAPYKPLNTDDSVPKYAGGGSNNSGSNSNNSLGNSAYRSSNPTKKSLNQAQINQRFLGGSVNGNQDEFLEPIVYISKPDNGSDIELKQSQHVLRRFSRHRFTASDTPASVAQQYSGQADPKVIYNYNDHVNKSNPPTTGDAVKVPSGWDTRVEGSVTNATSVEVKWQGATSGSTHISIPTLPPHQTYFWETRLTLDSGTYVITANADGASHSINIGVLGNGVKDGIPTHGGRRALTLNELNVFIERAPIAQEQINNFIRVLNEQKIDPKVDTDSPYEKIMKSYGYLDPYSFENTRLFLIENATATVSLISSVPADKLYYVSGGKGAYGEATYYDEYSAIGFGDGFLKGTGVSTITHEYAHAVFAPAEVDGIKANNAHSHYKNLAASLHSVDSIYAPATQPQLELFNEIKTSAYVFDQAVSYAQPIN